MKVFIDTSVIVEYLKGNHADFYKQLVSGDQLLFINQVVVSEFLFHFIALNGNKSPLSVKTSGQIAETFANLNPYDLIPDCFHLGHNLEIARDGLEIMKKYNLLPNDALILATCRFFGIDNIATYDSDFLLPGIDMNIRIINKISDLE